MFKASRLALEAEVVAAGVGIAKVLLIWTPGSGRPGTILVTVLASIALNWSRIASMNARQTSSKYLHLFLLFQLRQCCRTCRFGSAA